MTKVVSKLSLWQLTVLVVGLVAVAIGLNALLFMIIWNSFVATHVAGVVHTTFWGSIVPGAGVAALCGRGISK